MYTFPENYTMRLVSCKNEKNKQTETDSLLEKQIKQKNSSNFRGVHKQDKYIGKDAWFMGSFVEIKEC